MNRSFATRRGAAAVAILSALLGSASASAQEGCFGFGIATAQSFTVHGYSHKAAEYGAPGTSSGSFGTRQDQITCDGETSRIRITSRRYLSGPGNSPPSIHDEETCEVLEGTLFSCDD